MQRINRLRPKVHSTVQNRNGVYLRTSDLGNEDVMCRLAERLLTLIPWKQTSARASMLLRTCGGAVSPCPGEVTETAFLGAGQKGSESTGTHPSNRVNRGERQRKSLWSSGRPERQFFFRIFRTFFVKPIRSAWATYTQPVLGWSQLTSFVSSKRRMMQTVKVSEKQALSIRCPTCGAKPGEKCELSTGLPRTDPHQDRRLAASDK